MSVVSIRRRRGAAAAEFALWMLPITSLLAVIVDGTFYISERHALSRICRDAARVGAATLEPFGGDGSDIEAAAQGHAEAAAGFMGFPDAAISTIYSVDGDDRAWITVRVTVERTPFFAGLSPFGREMRDDFTMMTMEQP